MNDYALVSGGFDPVHIGHIRMFTEAKKIGSVIIGLNSDDWLMRKKGFIFMPFEERKEILLALNAVKEIEAFDDSDDTCIKFIERWAEIQGRAFGWVTVTFCNGGDRNNNTTPEVKFCAENDINLAWDIGGKTKAQSSQELVKNAKRKS